MGHTNSIVLASGLYGYSEMMRDLELLRGRYPFLEIETAGRSVLGRTIPAVRLGRGRIHAHANGAMHANEWITAPLLMRFVEMYAAAWSGRVPLNGHDVSRFYADTSLWIVPMVNPDGVELVHRGLEREHPFYRRLIEWNGGSSDFSGWKANIRGVDLNDQFPAGWEEEKKRRHTDGPGPRDYSGEGPLTEPEAQLLYAFTRLRDFQWVIALHTQGREIYWNYRGMEPPESEAIAARFARASGYRPVRLTDSDAGYKDWFIQEFRRPGFTIEAGLGSNPLPIGYFLPMYEEVSGILLEALSL